MTIEPLHNAILRVLELCNRAIAYSVVPCDWRTIEDLLLVGLGDAKLDRGPCVHVKEFMGMPPGTVVPGVAYHTKNGFTCLHVGRTDAIRKRCLIDYKTQPGERTEQEPSGRTYQGFTSQSTPIGEVVDVLILVDYKPQPSKSPPRPVYILHQNSLVDQDDIGARRDPIR